ncbi:MAG: PLP-dependent aminotransferase family protein [Proteobacteria bacterium]|nr:PLP-dependent aminotransferase family protein [Pseudomonadota bacterium]
MKVSRNTVAHVYENLAVDGFLSVRERSGYFISAEHKSHLSDRSAISTVKSTKASAWARKLSARPSKQAYVDRPTNWQSYRYPFIYGQIDSNLLSLSEWRECSKLALSKSSIEDWTSDAITEDDPELAEQICTRLLPRRGIFVSVDHLMITIGAQNALYLAGALVTGDDTTIGFEEPGYCDARNGFISVGAKIKPLPVDEHGIKIDHALDTCDIVYTTPSHHYPTNVTLPMERREALLQRADQSDFLIIEDDYESEVNFVNQPLPAVKSMDVGERVLYVSSLSKNLFPGLRIGYMVAPPDFISEARALRRQMYRHPSTNVQRTVALFIKLGYYDTMVKRLHSVYRERWAVTGEALEKYCGDYFSVKTFGGTSFWVTGPEGLDARRLAREALKKGVVLEPGAPMFLNNRNRNNCFRVGFSSIPTSRIEKGIQIIAGTVGEIT